MTTTGLDRKLVTQLLPRSPGAEAYRVLRTNLQFMAVDQPLRSLLITSSAPEEGKSLTCANLAVAFAQGEQRVVLVDADLRKPMVAKMFGISGRWGGLTSVVAGNMALDDALHPTEIENLTLLPSGPIPPNPAELLGSSRIPLLLQELKERFDIVIVDTPPVLAVTDACVLASRVDGVLLTVRANRVGHPQVRRARQALTAVRARILGAVLDGFEAPGGGHYDYYYYQYYGRG